MSEHLYLESAQNPRIKAATALRERKHRRAQGRTLIDGRREVIRATEAGVVVEQLFLAEESFTQESANWKPVVSEETEVFHVRADTFARMAYGDRHDGWLAVVRTPEPTLAALRLPDNPCLAVVERVEKPGNLGAVLRSAEGAGFSAVLVADPATDLFNPNVIRASLGTVFSMPVCCESAAVIKSWLLDRELTIFATQVDAPSLYYQADFTQPMAIVLGSEAEGLTPIWRDQAVTGLRLPMHGIADSLNVSATAAVVFYETLRQRSVATRN